MNASDTAMRPVFIDLDDEKQDSEQLCDEDIARIVDEAAAEMQGLLSVAMGRLQAACDARIARLKLKIARLSSTPTVCAHCGHASSRRDADHVSASSRAAADSEPQMAAAGTPLPAPSSSLSPPSWLAAVIDTPRRASLHKQTTPVDQTLTTKQTTVKLTGDQTTPLTIKQTTPLAVKQTTPLTNKQTTPLTNKQITPLTIKQTTPLIKQTSLSGDFETTPSRRSEGKKYAWQTELRHPDGSVKRPRRDDGVAVTEVVRGKAARQQMTGHECSDCSRWYAQVCDQRSRAEAVQSCSRHRTDHQRTPPSTPPGIWDLSFCDSPS